MRRVVISGATGMIGNALLVECIKNEVEVLVILRPNSRHNDRIPKSHLITRCECSLNRLNEFDFSQYRADWDVFYHFGWNFTASKFRNDVELQNLNIDFTLDAIKVAQKLGCKKFVGAGSQAEYGKQDMRMTSPEAPINPLTAYGVAKYNTGRMARLWCSQNDMDCFWCRIFSVYGKYDLPTTMVSTAILKLLHGEHVSFTAGVQLWDYIYSEDAGRAFYLIGENATGNKVYCIGSGKARPLREFIEIIRDVVAPGVSLGIGEIPYQNEPSHLWADISELEKDTTFKPQIPFPEGVYKTAEWMKKEVNT